MAREGALFTPVRPGEVDAPSLPEVADEADPGRLAVERGTREFVVEQAAQAIERGLVAAVRCRGQQEQVPLLVLGPVASALRSAAAGFD